MKNIGQERERDTRGSKDQGQELLSPSRVSLPRALRFFFRASYIFHAVTQASVSSFDVPSRLCCFLKFLVFVFHVVTLAILLMPIGKFKL